MAPTLLPAFLRAQGSPIREIMRHAAEPGVVSLAGGYPAPECFDEEGIRAAIDDATAQGLQGILQYGLTEGDAAFRQALAALLATRGLPVRAEEVLVLSGSQQGFDLLVRTLVAPGDRVLTESPTYPATLAALRLAGAAIAEVASDADGLRPEALEDALRAGPAKFLYLTPNFSNPTGSLLSRERRRALLDIASRHGLPIVEDDPYRDLSFGDEPLPPSLAALAHEQGIRHLVCHLGSLSKTVAPGLRIGFAVLPAEIHRACVLAKQVGDLHSSRLSQAVARSYLASGRLSAHLQRVRAIYAGKARALAGALRRRLPEDVLEFDMPRGGMFLWAKFLDGTDTQALVALAQEEKVLFVPGACFLDAPAQSSFLRLSFSGLDEAGMEAGAQRLRQAWLRYARRHGSR